MKIIFVVASISEELDEENTRIKYAMNNKKNAHAQFDPLH